MEPFLVSTGYSPGKDVSGDSPDTSGGNSSGSITVRRSVTNKIAVESPFGVRQAMASSAASVPCAPAYTLVDGRKKDNLGVKSSPMVDLTEETIEVSSTSSKASRASEAARLLLEKRLLLKKRELRKAKSQHLKSLAKGSWQNRKQIWKKR